MFILFLADVIYQAKMSLSLQNSSIFGGTVLVVISPLFAKTTTGIDCPPGCTFR